MPTPIAPPLILSQNARTDLHTLIRAHSTPQSLALRARLVRWFEEADEGSRGNSVRTEGHSLPWRSRALARTLVLRSSTTRKRPRPGRAGSGAYQVPRPGWSALGVTLHRQAVRSMTQNGFVTFRQQK